MKKIKLLSLLLALSTFAFAQTPVNLTGASTATNFDGGSLDNGSGSLLNTFPAGWGLEELGSGSSANGFYRAGTGSSNAGDARSFGMASNQERAFGGVASGSVQPMLGFAFRNNTGNAITSMNVSYTGEQWRAGDTNPLVDSLLFEYSLNASSIGDMSATWTAVSALDFLSPNPTGGMSSGSLDGNLAGNKTSKNSMITVNVPNGDTVRFRWRDINISGSDDGLSVDDFTMTVTTTGGPLPPSLLSTTPADNATNVPLSTTSLTLTFDQALTSLGTGNARLTNMTTLSSVNIPIGSITYVGSTATLTGVTLVSNNDYSVQIDSGIFIAASGAYTGISDSTIWNFKSENTTPPPAITSLNESFTGCQDPNFGVFKAHSAVGGQNWRCTTFGHNDSNAVYMNGYAGSPQDNEDWLVSPPLDFSLMTTPHLHFWSKLRFPANTTKEFMVSTNYSGLGNPTLATWTPIQVNNWSGLDTTWKWFLNTDLTQYKGSNFHIAFKYTSDTTAADEWTLDDIMVTDGPLSISTFSANDLSVRVLGAANSNLNIQTQSAHTRKLNYSILDMTGRVISKGMFNVIQGKQNHSFNTSALNSGMYFLSLNNEQAKTTVKFLIK